MSDISTTLSGGIYNFPRLDKPDSQKKEDYHVSFARAILHRSIDDGWSTSYSLMSELYKFMEEGSNGELLDHLQKSADGTDLPALWLSLNKIPTKVDLLIGELEARGYEIRVRALNKEAISRKQEEKERLRVKRRLQGIMKEVEAQTGLPMGESEYIPQSESELNEYIDLSFKDKAEIIMEGALKWLAKRNMWDEERKALFRDILAVNRAFVKNEIIRGIPFSRRIHPQNMIFDTSCKKDDLSDATFFGEVEYMSIAAAAERYNLSDKEIEEVYNAYQSFVGLNVATEAIGASDWAYSFNTIGGKRLKWFKTIDGDLKVLVGRTCWRDYKTITHKNEINPKYGTEHLQRLPDNDEIRDRDKTKLITNKLEVWRQCTLIGGHIVREWGECPNQARSVGDLATTEPPYKGWIPNYSTGRGVSKVEQLSSIQLYKDILFYNMELAIMRAGARGMTYDLAMVPEGWTPEKIIKYMKVHGISFYNSKDFQFLPGSNTSPFREFDQTLSDSIERYVNIMSYLDRQMDEISGVTAERQGTVQGASQGLGVTQAALFQSNLITQPYFVGFERFCSRILNHQAKLVKIAWEGKEVFSPIIGDTGIDFLKEHIDLDLDDFGVIVESVPPIFADRQKLEQMVMLVIQSDPSFIDDGLAILMESDTRVAVRRFQRRRYNKKMLESQQLMLQQQQEAAIQQRLEALESQNQEREIRGNLAQVELKNAGALERSIQQGRVKLSDSKIKALAELQKEALKNETKSTLEKSNKK